MAKIRPFRAVRPTPALAEKVAALPYDVMNSAEAKEMVGDNEYSFLHVDKAEIDLPEGTGLYDDIVYETAAARLRKMIADGTFIKDDKPCYYVYRQIMDGRAQTGIVGCASIDDYFGNVIKKHELTRRDKEDDRCRHVDVCDANTGPIFLAYRARGVINGIVDRVTAAAPVYDFVSGGVQQTVWVIDNDADIATLSGEFAAAGDMYIADGHHRTASAARVGRQRREAHPGYSGEEEFNYFLAVMFPDEQLYIMDYNRVVKDLNGLDEAQFIGKIEESFTVEPYEGEGPCHPPRRHTFGMYLGGRWYLLTAKEGTFDPADPVGQLDVSILHENLLHPVLGIGDPRTDKRIAFIGGIRGLGELERRCHEDMTVAFAMYPTSIGELINIADAGLLMPPKSTWFEPKLLSGLFIHKLS